MKGTWEQFEKNMGSLEIDRDSIRLDIPVVGLVVIRRRPSHSSYFPNYQTDCISPFMQKVGFDATPYSSLKTGREAHVTAFIKGLLLSEDEDIALTPDYQIVREISE